MPNRKTLPVISGKDVVKILCKNGFIVRRQTGSHIIIKREKRQVVVPNHDEVDRGTLRSIIKQAGLTVDEFLDSSELNTKIPLGYPNGKH
jgi:Predicted periplasmic or secreted lipoprotein